MKTAEITFDGVKAVLDEEGEWTSEDDGTAFMLNSATKWITRNYCSASDGFLHAFIVGGLIRDFGGIIEVIFLEDRSGELVEGRVY